MCAMILCILQGTFLDQPCVVPCQGSGRWLSTEAIFRTSCASASPAKSPCEVSENPALGTNQPCEVFPFSNPLTKG